MNTNIPAADRQVEATDNLPDYAKEETLRLESEFLNTVADVNAALNEARECPKVVEDDAAALSMGAVVKRIRDLVARIKAFREKEVEPHLRRQNAINAFFFSLQDKLVRRDKNAIAGALDILAARVADYQARKLAREQEERAAAARAARIEEEKRQAAAREAARLAEEARLTAERARAPAKIEEKQQAAEVQQTKAVEANVEATMATGAALDAHIDTLAKPADMVRTRGDDGVLLTMATEPYAVVEDRSKLDFVKLGPFFTQGEVEKALRAYAKNTGYTVMMEGAAIGKRPKSVIR